MRNQKALKNLFISGFIVLPAVGLAAPSKFQECAASRNIKAPVHSGGFYMDENCQTVYVLPPTLGSLQISAFVPNVQREMCTLINGELNSLLAAEKSFRSTELAIERKEKLLAKAERDLEVLQEKYSNRENQLITVRSKMSAIEKQRSDKQSLLEAKQTKYQECVALTAPSPDQREDCGELKSEIENQNDAIDELSQQFDRIQEVLPVYQAAVDELSATIEFKKREQEQIKVSITEAIETVRTRRKALYQRLSQLTKDSTRTSGATMSVIFQSGHQELVKRFAELNSPLGLNFVAMPIKASFLTVAAKKRPAITFDGNDSIILETKINGLKSQAELNGSTPEKNLLLEDATSESIVFGQAAGGQLVINRLAACEIMGQAMGQTNSRKAISALANLFAPTVTYKYELQVGAEITYRYREDHLYQLIRQQTSSNGLFSMRSTHSLLELGEYKKWIDIEITSEDSGHRFENPLKIADDLRARKLDEALLKVAKSYNQNVQAPGLIEPPSPGSHKLADQAKQCPYLFCRYATAVLNLGDALFGGTVAESQMERRVHASEAETINVRDMMAEIGTMSLSAE